MGSCLGSVEGNSRHAAVSDWRSLISGLCTRPDTGPMYWHLRGAQETRPGELVDRRRHVFGDGRFDFMLTCECNPLALEADAAGLDASSDRSMQRGDLVGAIE